VLSHLPSSLHLDRITRQQAGAAAIAALTAAGIAWYALTRPKIDPEDVELQRRTLLARAGRIIDGTIVGIDHTTEDTSLDGMVDVPPEDFGAPQIIIYRYRVAGATYECAQDVVSLAEQVRHLRIDLPVQVRYDPHNPGNSIVVAEHWNGVRFDEPQTVEASMAADAIRD